jgi:uncharacterized protein
MSQPGVIDGLQFARTEGVLEGRLILAQLPRLAESQCATEGLTYAVRGEIGPEGRPRLRIWVRGTLQMVCQRCLGPVALPLEIDADLVLSGSRAEIETADDDVDYIFAGKAMAVSELVEEEVLLVLPMAPRHEQCKGIAADAPQRKSSPFAVLGKLKG